MILKRQKEEVIKYSNKKGAFEALMKESKKDFEKIRYELNEYDDRLTKQINIIEEGKIADLKISLSEERTLLDKPFKSLKLFILNTFEKAIKIVGKREIELKKESFLHMNKQKEAILMFHGYGGNSEENREMASSFVSRDFSVSLFEISSCGKFGFTNSLALLAAAFPKTTKSINEFEPNLFAPCTETQAASTMAINPGTILSLQFEVITSAL